MSLMKRNGIYYAQVAVPQDVQHILKTKLFRKSTGCRSRNTAMLEAAPLVEAWKRQIRMAREEPDAILEEMAVLKARTEAEKLDPTVEPNEWGYLPSEVELEAKGLDDSDWLSSLPPSQAAKYVDLLHGENTHHIIEAVFKALGRALAQAVQPDDRVKGHLSSKGTL